MGAETNTWGNKEAISYLAVGGAAQITGSALNAWTPPAVRIFEHGSIDIVRSWNPWQTVELAHTFTNPVVFVQADINPGGAFVPVVARVKEVSSTSFQVNIILDSYDQNAQPGQSGRSKYQRAKVNWVVAEKGTWTVGGATVYVDTFSTSGADQYYITKEKYVALPSSFATPPAVLLGAQAYNKEGFIGLRAIETTSSQFKAILQVEKAQSGVDGFDDGLTDFDETIGVLAISQSSTVLPDGSTLEGMTTPIDSCTFPDDVNYVAARAAVPTVIATTATLSGWPAIVPRLSGVTAEGFKAVMMRDRSELATKAETNTWGNKEAISYLAVGGAAQITGSALNAWTPPAVRIFEHGSIDIVRSWNPWQTVELAHTFTNPVVFVQADINPGGAFVPVVARVKEVSSTSFQVNIILDSYDQNAQPGQSGRSKYQRAKVNWVVAEKGTWTVGGATVYVDTFSTSGADQYYITKEKYVAL